MKRILLLVLALMMLSCTAFAKDNEYKYVTSSEYADIYLDESSIHFTNDKTWAYMTKFVMTDKGKNDFINHRDDKDKYKDISCFYAGNEYDCTNDKERTIIYIWYGNNDKYIDTSETLGEWSSVKRPTVESIVIGRVGIYIKHHFDEVSNRPRI